MEKIKLKDISEIKEKKALEDLIEIKKVFDKYNIEFWLDCGVLLGAVREGRFIPWDRDIDLEVRERDIKKIVSVSKEFQKKGFKIILDRNGI